MKEKCAYCDKDSVYRFKGETPACITHYNRLYRYGDAHYKRKTNKYRIEGESTYLTTNQGIEFVIDTEDHDKIKGSTWVANQSGGYLVARKNNKNIRLHRVLMGVQNDPEAIVDHINGDVTDNRKQNLRITTHQENCQNTTYHKGTEVKYPGVSRTPDLKKYRARIMVDGKEIYLGRFDNQEDAIEVRKKAEKKYFGKHSYHKRKTITS